MAASSVRLVDAAAITAAASHKYGPVAGDDAALAGGTMRDVVLVYVDVRGLGRWAIVKRSAKVVKRTCREGVGGGSVQEMSAVVNA